MKRGLTKGLLYGLWILLCTFMLGEAFGRDLQQASNTYLTTVKNIAQVLSSAGILTGGIVMQLPSAEDFGKRILKGGFIGCIVAFGAPAFIGLMKAVFGTIG